MILLLRILIISFTLLVFNFTNMKKDIIKIIVKVIIYALGLIASYLGIASLSSCSIKRDFVHHGTGVFQYVDTLHVRGSNNIYYEQWK